MEATLAPIQQVRYVDPKMVELSRESKSQEIESTLQSDSFNNRKVPLPIVVGSSSERNAGSADFRAVITVTSTSTITSFYYATSTWTPVCSQSTPFTQCPAQVG